MAGQMNGGAEAGFPVAEEEYPVGRTRVAWGSVWAGLMVAVSVYLLLELLLFATGAREVRIDPSVNEAALITALAALVAFFVGGLVAGSSMPWTAAPEGALQGLVLWALGVVVFLVFAIAGTGLALGGVGTAVGELGVDLEAVVDDIDADAATDDAREAAGFALAGLTLMLAAAVGGGALGASVGAERRAPGPAPVSARTSTTAARRREELEQHTVEELRTMASDRDIEGRSQMNKRELVEALSRS